MADKTLTCSDCGQQFTFTASEQEFFAKKGFSDPSRCPDCRAARKAARSGGGEYHSSGGSSMGERQMYPAVCAQCGKQTEVPFKPSGDRPVYCSDCYQQQRGGSSRSSYGGGGGGRSSGGSGRSSSGGGGRSRW
jgi:CxxC-x17-CxxC domain-containing protein